MRWTALAEWQEGVLGSCCALWREGAWERSAGLCTSVAVWLGVSGNPDMHVL